MNTLYTDIESYENIGLIHMLFNKVCITFSPLYIIDIQPRQFYNNNKYRKFNDVELITSHESTFTMITNNTQYISLKIDNISRTYDKTIFHISNDVGYKSSVKFMHIRIVHGIETFIKLYILNRITVLISTETQCWNLKLLPSPLPLEDKFGFNSLSPLYSLLTNTSMEFWKIEIPIEVQSMEKFNLEIHGVSNINIQFNSYMAISSYDTTSKHILFNGGVTSYVINEDNIISVKNIVFPKINYTLENNFWHYRNGMLYFHHIDLDSRYNLNGQIFYLEIIKSSPLISESNIQINNVLQGNIVATRKCKNVDFYNIYSNIAKLKNINNYHEIMVVIHNILKSLGIIELKYEETVGIVKTCLNVPILGYGISIIYDSNISLGDWICIGHFIRNVLPDHLALEMKYYDIIIPLNTLF